MCLWPAADLVDELVLVPGLHRSRTVLSDGGHKAKDIDGGVPLQHGLQADINGNQHPSAADASTAVDNGRTSGVSHLDVHEEVGDSLSGLGHPTDWPGGVVEVADRTDLDGLQRKCTLNVLH